MGIAQLFQHNNKLTQIQQDYPFIKYTCKLHIEMELRTLNFINFNKLDKR